jgi:hypothetical protein
MVGIHARNPISGDICDKTRRVIPSGFCSIRLAPLRRTHVLYALRASCLASFPSSIGPGVTGFAVRLRLYRTVNFHP